MGGALAVIAGLSDPGVTYWIKFDKSILGLYEGGMVEYLGVPVGKVKNISVDSENRAIVRLSIDQSKVTLYNGVKAQLVLYSFAAGSMAISLTGGVPGDGELPPGSEIQGEESIITAMGDTVSEVLSDVKKISDSISNGLAGIEQGELTEMMRKVDGLLDDAKRFMESANKMVDEANNAIADVRGDASKLVENLTQISEDAKPVAKNINELIATANEKLTELDVKAAGENLNKSLESVRELTDRLNKTMEGFDAIAANAQHEADNLEYSVRLSLEQMRQALGAMQRFVDQLSQDPAQLLRGKAKVKDQTP